MGGDTRDNYQSLVTLSITRMTLTHTLFVVINPFFLFFLSIIRITLTHTLFVVINPFFLFFSFDYQDYIDAYFACGDKC